jgi:hypothetical protein
MMLAIHSCRTAYVHSLRSSLQRPCVRRCLLMPADACCWLPWSGAVSFLLSYMSSLLPAAVCYCLFTLLAAAGNCTCPCSKGPLPNRLGCLHLAMASMRRTPEAAVSVSTPVSGAAAPRGIDAGYIKVTCWVRHVFARGPGDRGWGHASHERRRTDLLGMLHPQGMQAEDVRAVMARRLVLPSLRLPRSGANPLR